MIEQYLSYGGYHPVCIPTGEDDSVKEYLRMRDDHKKALKKVKQQINAFCLRHGYHYDGTKWTFAHLKWLKKLELSPLYQEALDEYMATYDEQIAKVEKFDARFEEIASQARYADKVKKLGCFLGIRTHTALSLIVETGDFNRFADHIVCIIRKPYGDKVGCPPIGGKLIYPEGELCAASAGNALQEPQVSAVLEFREDGKGGLWVSNMPWSIRG